jgi:Mn2+/Fe2+ NRAMP family transporter
LVGAAVRLGDGLSVGMGVLVSVGEADAGSSLGDAEADASFEARMAAS